MGIKIKLYIVFFIVIPVFVSCNNLSQEGGSNCINCITQKPEIGSITIDLTINSENDSVPLYIYKQLYKPGLTADTIIYSKQSTCVIQMKANQTYSIQAVYKSGSKRISAIDGGVFNAQEQSGCDISCWQLVGGKYDVKLKFNK